MVDDARWLLVTVTTAGAPATLRVHVWRRLRGLGALYLQQSVCLLPAEPRVTRQVQTLLDRVRRDGGTGRLLHITVDDPAERAELVTQFRAASDAEYTELLERMPALLEELATERARGKTSYVEVEESEADLARFRSWLSKVEARDYFDAPLRAQTRDRLAECEAALEDFAAVAFAVEHGPGAPADAPLGDGVDADPPGSLLDLDEPPRLADAAPDDTESDQPGAAGQPDGTRDEELTR